MIVPHDHSVEAVQVTEAGAAAAATDALQGARTDRAPLLTAPLLLTVARAKAAILHVQPLHPHVPADTVPVEQAVAAAVDIAERVAPQAAEVFKRKNNNPTMSMEAG